MSACGVFSSGEGHHLCLWGAHPGVGGSLVPCDAAGTVRRFLEKYADKIMAVVFCLQTDLDNDIYKR